MIYKPLYKQGHTDNSRMVYPKLLHPDHAECPGKEHMLLQYYIMGLIAVVEMKNV